jgi:hypothetical protein
MHDEKLSKGLARQFIRKIKKLSEFGGGPLGQVLRPVFVRYQMSVISNVVSTAADLENQIVASVPCSSWSTNIPHPSKKRIILEVIVPNIVKGGEQDHLVFGGTLYDLARTELGVVETSLHTAISHHALSRLYQRSTFSEENVKALIECVTMYVAPFLFLGSALNFVQGTGITIPFLDGLLLGTVDWSPLKSDEGPTFGTVSRAGISDLIMLDLPYGVTKLDSRGVMTIEINTFIGERDIFPSQRAISEKILRIGNQFGPSFFALRAGIMRGYPDSRMRERFKVVEHDLSLDDLQEIAVDMSSLFSTPEWKNEAQHHTARYSSVARRKLH